MTKRKAPPRRGRPPRKNKGGRPPHEPTPESHQFVRMLAIGGYAHPQIAEAVRINETTLRKYYRDDLDIGKARVDAMFTQTVISKGLGGRGTKDEPYNWRDASERMIELYMRTRMGWHNPKQEIAHSGAVGNYDLSKLSDDEIDRVEKILTRAAISGVAGALGGEDEA